MTTCILCGSLTQRVINSLPGYQEGKTFDINYCENCDTSVASPLAVDEALYNLIYANAKSTPGYDRYYRYAGDVLQVKDPLRYLAESEDTYWSISHFIKTINKRANPKILEVGCGLGYLTYALIKDGYAATGIDISEQAIKEATRRYGDYYICGDVKDPNITGQYAYDIIILTEVIEHIPDPVGFIASLKRLLAKEGAILITTPNKEADTNKHEYWNTELPPVHLWWLSRKSFISMAGAIDMQASFIDYTLFVNKQVNYPVATSAWRKQTLSENRQVLFQVPHNRLRYNTKRKLIDLNVLSLLKTLVLSTTKRRPIVHSQRLTAILSIV